MSSFKRVIIIILVLSLTSLSCKAPVIDLSSIFGPGYYQPGDELPETDEPYTFVDLDPKLIPEPVATKNETVIQGNEAVGGTVEKEITTATAYADDNGVAAIEDARLDLMLPIVVVDKDGRALKSAALDYLSVGNMVMITASDRDDTYEPVTITITLDELLGSIEEKTALPGNGLAAPARSITLSGILIILGVLLTAKSVYELAVDPPQFIETLGDPPQICASGAQLGDLTSATIGFIFIGNSIIQVVKDTVIVGVTGIALSEGSGYLVDLGLDEPLLYEYYYPGEGVSDKMLERYGLDPDGFQGYFRPVGKCHYVPDLVGFSQQDATSTLSALPLEYTLVEATELGDYEAGVVERQYPEPYGDSPLFGTNVETMLPEVPVSDAGRVQLTISIGMRPRTIPNLIGMSLADAESALTSLGLYMVVTRSVPCVNVGEGQVSNQNPLPDTPFEAGDVVEVEECTGPPSSGDVQATLIWYTTADLDLMVEDPDGYEIYYGSTTSPSGGQLDVDANGYCDYLTTTPVENIYWDYGAAPSGYYRVYIVYSLVCENEGDVDYTVIVLVDGVTQEFSGTISPYETVDIYEFTR